MEVNFGKSNEFSIHNFLHVQATEFWKIDELSIHNFLHVQASEFRKIPMNSLSLSLSLYTHIITTYKKGVLHILYVCPESYLYIYDFRSYLHIWPQGAHKNTFTYVSPSNRSGGSPPGLRSSGSPKLPIRRDLFPNRMYTILCKIGESRKKIKIENHLSKSIG